ncbi:MAG TPA: hypothetical protein O0W91_00065 [Methanocorpusculum sp.]|nr:hypothetical protein [Methanocorpusculum sp.]HJK01658.1 hypothetical protein [Methanocorpusculum sp.]
MSGQEIQELSYSSPLTSDGRRIFELKSAKEQHCVDKTGEKEREQTLRICSSLLSGEMESSLFHLEMSIFNQIIQSQFSSRKMQKQIYGDI